MNRSGGRGRVRTGDLERDKLAGPAGLPADIVRKVNHEINVAMAKPESQQRMREDGMLVHAMDAAAFRKFIEDEGVRWKPVIERAGLMEK